MVGVDRTNDVYQSVWTRFLHQRIFMILQMLFVLIMISSLSVDFDQYYVSFLIGYIGLRALTSIQYLIVQKFERDERKKLLCF